MAEDYGWRRKGKAEEGGRGERREGRGGGVKRIWVTEEIEGERGWGRDGKKGGWRGGGRGGIRKIKERGEGDGRRKKGKGKRGRRRREKRVEEEEEVVRDRKGSDGREEVGIERERGTE